MKQAPRVAQDPLEQLLKDFAERHAIKGKGPLSVMLAVTSRARTKTVPFRKEDFTTSQGGQVAGAGKAVVQAILAKHGITRVLAEEGGRTSRGSLRKMEVYIKFLNLLHKEGILDLDRIEQWWVSRVNAFFRSKPFRLKIDSARSLRMIVRELVEAAFARQKERQGTTVAGTVMQHLVGAKLQIILPEGSVQHRGASVADAAGGEKADFLIADTAIHVTTLPTEALIRKCAANLAENLQPLIITTREGADAAKALARAIEGSERIDILEIEQFMTTNIYEWCAFAKSQRAMSLRKLVTAYNQIVERCETDPSLRILVGEG